MNKTRVTLDLLPDEFQKLEDIVEWTSSSSKVDAIRRAIRREHALREHARVADPALEVYQTAFAL